MRLLALALLTIIASLNRETGIFIPLAFALLAFRTRRERRWALVYVALSVAVFVGLRLLLGNPAFYNTRESLLAHNLGAGMANAYPPLFALHLLCIGKRRWLVVVNSNGVEYSLRLK